MGDAQRSLQEEQEAETEMKKVLHRPPIHPLPEEIKKMDHSETVCRYCGVSYLIFHEFHQLNTKLAHLEAELQKLRGAAPAEKARREALELGRLEWERALRLEVQRLAEEKEKSTREELEERGRDTERALREEFEHKHERWRSEMKEQQQKAVEEHERRLRGELGGLEEERRRRQREELEKRSEEREKVLGDALQKANKNSDELRKCLQQLEERLAEAASAKEEAALLLGKEKRRGEILRGVRGRQQEALRAALDALGPLGGELTAVRGFLGQLTWAWQDFRSQILQHSTQVFSAMKEELERSSVGLRKIREEREQLAQQLMEQKRQREEQLCQQREHEQQICRLKGELEDKHERRLSCQRRCDTLEEQLSSWRRREEQAGRKCRAAEEEVTRLMGALEKNQQETRQLRREREMQTESHNRALTKMEGDSRKQTASKLAAALEEQRTQNALHLREKMEELRRDLDLELTVEREKNRLLLLQYERDGTKLQQKLQERERALRGLQDELQKERRTREEETHQQGAERQLMAETNTELQEEVALLQETVRRECEEREGLTAALSQAHKELRGLRPRASHQGSSKSPPSHVEKHTTRGNKPLQSQSRTPLTRSLNSPNTLRPSPASADRDGGRGPDGGGAGGGSLDWSLPRLAVSSEVKPNMSLVMERKERL